MDAAERRRLFWLTDKCKIVKDITNNSKIFHKKEMISFFFYIFVVFSNTERGENRNMKEISIETLNNMRETYLKSDKARVVRNALTKNDITTISRSFEAVCENPSVFSIDLKTMPVTNQMASGRCWIFSSMNVLREKIASKFGIKDFELSQNFIAFYDKLEKANWFMNCVTAEKDSDKDSPEMRYLLGNAVGDGGQWNMLVSIVKKYGLCPKTAMPETYQSSHTGGMNRILNQRLKKFACDIRKMNDEEMEAYRAKTTAEIFGLLADCFGLPPMSFTFEYVDKNDVHHAEYNVTPLDFYHKYLGVDLDSYVNIMNGPTADKPYYHQYTVKYLGNVAGGNPISMVNLPLDEFKGAILAQLKDGNPVWFGCDCGPDGDREAGLWDDKAYCYGDTFDMDLSMSKAEMLDYRQSAMNHAMVFTGVNLVDGKPTRWKIENSWGDKVANKGYFTCSDSWFDKYMYVAAVERKYLSEKALAALDEKPVELAPWDPFGTLAD